jgi:hypothetical protein
MKTINIREHSVKISAKNVEYTGQEHDITFSLDTGNPYILKLNYEEYIFDCEVMKFYFETKHGQQYARLKHLYIPESIQGLGLGKLCLSIFYNFVTSNGINMFSMKFGGGAESYKFLKSAGFSDKYIETKSNLGIQGNSVVVGEYKSFGSEHNQWKLDPISISEFPESLKQ